jgi:hypothetical protein
VVVEHSGKTRRIAAGADIGAAPGPRRADDGKGRMGKEIAAMDVEPVELLENREFHRFLVEPAQRGFIAHRNWALNTWAHIWAYGPIVHWTLRL